MLVLTRKIGEQVVIGDNIRVTVVSVGPGRVKIGIEAPTDVSVDRAEIHEKKLTERSPDAATVGPPCPAVAVGEDVLTLHNRIATKLPVAVVAEHKPAPMSIAASPTPTGVRAKINRKPR